MPCCRPELDSGSGEFNMSQGTKDYYVYILTNVRNSVFYIGVTNNLKSRVYEHKQKLVDGFTKRYNLIKLVYYEQTTDINSALEREKQLKRWHRLWKLDLITKDNPSFKDLYQEL